MCKVNDQLYAKLLDFKDCSFRSTLLKLNIDPTVMNNFKQKKTKYIDFHLLLKLAEYQNLRLDFIKQNINNMRVNRSTDIQDKEFIDFVFENKI